MRIIVTADDFGYSDDTVDSTIECFEAGTITSASIMANMPATGRALDYARHHPEFSFGVHLTFVGDGAERSLSDPESVSALVDRKGRFGSARHIRSHALSGLLPRSQIEREMRAQLSLVADSGVVISHVDSHLHLHKLAPFRATLAKVLPDYGTNKVRNAQNTFLRKPLLSPTFWLGHLWRDELMKLFDTTDDFFMPTSAGDENWHKKVLDRIGGNSVEVAGHPGVRDKWRAQEKNDLTRFSSYARERGFKLIGWREL